MIIIIDKDDTIVRASESEDVKYAKTQSNGTIIRTERQDATSVYCEDNDTFYAIRETIPGEIVYRIAEVDEIPQGIPLAAMRYEDGEIIVDIETLRALKLIELSNACQFAIFGGVDVETSKGIERFALTINDQTNIGNLAAQAQGGATVLYHADGQLCRVFSPEEMLTVVAAAIAHKTYHTTLCNHMNVWVRRSEDVEELASISYGSPLPADLAANIESLLSGIT